MTVCSTCGCSDFYTNYGFYFCSRCQTQLEGDQEVVFEEGTVSQGKKVVDKHKEEKTEGTLTSWEVCNYTLKFLVDRMIELGASKDLKPIVLQLWATYLARLQIAFCSSENVVHVTLATRNRDIKVLTGKGTKKPGKKKSSTYFATKQNLLKRKKMKKAQSKRLDTFDESEPNLNQSRKRQLTKFKRKIAAAEYSQSQDFIEESSQILSQTQTLDSIGDTTTDKDTRRLIMNRQSKLYWKAMKTEMVGKSLSEKKKFMRKVLNRQRKTCQNITISSVWALLQLGMILSRQKATLSDTIRWNLEGHISHSDVIELLPFEFQGEYLNKLLHNHRLTHTALKETMTRIANFVSVTHFPSIDFNELIARYMKELNLPEELQKKVLVLFILLKPNKYFSDKVLAFDCEAITMAYIIITLKLFFGLDGKTEFLLSKLSNHLNRITGPDGSKYFSWSEWTRYIECRKCVVANFHYPTRITHCSKLKSILSDNNSFLNYIREKKIMVSSKTSKTTDWEKHIVQSFEGLGISNKSSPEFLPSLTPLSSNVDSLLNDRSYQFSSAVTDLLCEKFTKQHLILPDMYARLSKSYKLIINSNRESIRPRTVSNFESISDDPIPHSFENFNVEAVIVDERKTNLSKGSLETSGKTSYSPDKIRESSPKSTKSLISKKRKRRSSFSIDVSKISQQLLENRLSEVSFNKDSSHETSGETSCSPDKLHVSSPKSTKSPISKKSKRRSSFSIDDINVSKIAKQLLKNRLSEVSCSKDFSNLSISLASSSSRENFKGESFTVDYPYEHYWVLHFHKSISKHDFKNLSKLLFPVTFYWLLHECSNMINVCADDLYLYVTKVERNMQTLLS